MRKALVSLTILLVASFQVARADISYSAPADEYFGPSSQSVLEIRNRLNDFDQRDGRDMLDSSVGASLDHLEIAILDWQHKYPRDPWLPATLAHLMREYWRAGESSSERGTAALAVMRSAYPDASETTATVSLIFGSNPTLEEVSRDEQTPPSYETPPSEVAQPDDVQPSYAAPASEIAPDANVAPGSDQGVPGDVAANSNPSTAVDQAPASDEAVPESDVPTPPPTR